MPTLPAPVATRVRSSVYALQVGDRTLYWYAVGVRRMQARPISDPLSWRYQAARHEYNRTTDPFAASTDVLPSAADQTLYWNACQHGGAYFLPWHRFYLTLFERIVGAEIQAAGGPADWGLPYWDYSESLATSPHARELPPDFRQPASLANALYVAQRRTTANGGLPFATNAEVSVASLASTPFATVPSASSHGFGGQLGAPIHSGGAGGSLEDTPHGSMHIAIGGISPGASWMSSFDTAALDPVFWLHHANIDRLWEVWRARHPLLANPADPGWLAQAFDFHDDTGAPVNLPIPEALDIKGQLGYDYDPPILLIGAGGLPAAPTALVPGAVPLVPPVAANVMKAIVSPTPVPVLVQVSAAALPLTHQASSVALTPAPVAPAPPALGPMAATLATAPQQTFLHLENVTADRPAEAYEVYLGVPPGADPRLHPERFAGLLPMFGVREASIASAHRAGDGRTVTFNVTAVLAALGLPPDGGSAPLRVSFVRHRDADVPLNPPVQAQVGRISLYVE